MKLQRISFLIVVVSFLFFSCSKDEGKDLNDGNLDLSKDFVDREAFLNFDRVISIEEYEKAKEQLKLLKEKEGFGSLKKDGEEEIDWEEKWDEDEIMITLEVVEDYEPSLEDQLNTTIFSYRRQNNINRFTDVTDVTILKRIIKLDLLTLKLTDFKIDEDEIKEAKEQIKYLNSLEDSK